MLLLPLRSELILHWVVYRQMLHGLRVLRNMVLVTFHGVPWGETPSTVDGFRTLPGRFARRFVLPRRFRAFTAVKETRMMILSRRVVRIVIHSCLDLVVSSCHSSFLGWRSRR